MAKRLDQKLAQSIAQAIEQGLSVTDAARLSLVSPDLLRQWIKCGNAAIDEMWQNEWDAPNEQYAAEAVLASLCAQALARRKQTLLENIKRKSARSWMADAWLLERQWPDEFGNPTRTPPVDTTKLNGVTVTVYLPDNGRGDGTTNSNDAKPADPTSS